MNTFNRPRRRWGRAAIADEPPAPHLTGTLERQCVALPDALAILEHVPGPGQALHALMTGRYDLMALLVALIERIGVVEAMAVSTLSFHAKNLAQMLALLDVELVRRLDLLACTFFKNTNKALFVETQQEFRQRKQRVAAARTHAKVITLAAADGRRFTLEGSANLRHNDCWEQFALVNDTALHDWHAAWITDMIGRHEGEVDEGH